MCLTSVFVFNICGSRNDQRELDLTSFVWFVLLSTTRLMDLSKLVQVKEQGGDAAVKEEAAPKRWQDELPSKEEEDKLTRAEKLKRLEQRQLNLKKQMKIAEDNVKRRQRHTKQNAKLKRMERATRDRSWGSKLSQSDDCLTHPEWLPTTGTKFEEDRIQKLIEKNEQTTKESKEYAEYTMKRNKTMAAIPKFDPKLYTPEKKKFEPRRKKHEHDFVVFSETPGPGSYDLNSERFGANVGGGRFSNAVVKSSIEWIQYYAKQIPSPAEYGSPSIPGGKSPSTRFPATISKSDLEWTIWRAKQTPGPGQYLGSGTLPLPKGGVMSSSVRKTDVDWAIYRASTQPGPMDYPAPELPRKGGGCISKYKSLTDVEKLILEAKQKPGPSDYADAYIHPILPKGGRINGAKSKTWLEWVEYQAKQTPGSCDYPAPRLKRAGGGRFSNAKPKTDVEWLMYHKSQIPGPGQYTPKGAFDPSILKGGRFNEARPKTSIELLQNEAKEMPAPGDYNPREIRKSGVNQRFNMSKPKTEVEWLIYHAKQTPGPGQYESKTPEKKGGKFSNAFPKSDVDWSIHRARQIPGPGQYKLPTMDPGALFGKISEAKPKTHLEWVIHYASQIPGPGAHRVPRWCDDEKDRWRPLEKQSQESPSQTVTKNNSEETSTVTSMVSNGNGEKHAVGLRGSASAPAITHNGDK